MTGSSKKRLHRKHFISASLIPCLLPNSVSEKKKNELNTGSSKQKLPVPNTLPPPHLREEGQQSSVPGDSSSVADTMSGIDTASSSTSSQVKKMEARQKLRDLQWGYQVIKSASLNLHSISFYLSQPTSGCHQETENSMNINISKESLSHLSDLLLLLTTQSTQASLSNLEFHQVEWELQQVRNLGSLLESSSSINQLVFKRNSLTVECLSELSEVLKKNVGIKEIMLSESNIGSIGASLLASALKVNRSLENLQIWEDSIGSKGAEELSKMIEVNSTLKLLTIFDSKSITATPLISAVLARNRSMEVHIWSGQNNEKTSKVVEFVPENSTLRIYRLDVSGACRVAGALGMNSTVKSLDLTGVRLNSRWAKEFRWILEQNRTLKEVNLSNTCLKDKGVVYVAAGLFKNQSLQKLYLNGNWFGGVGVEHLLCPLSRFSALQYQANVTLKSLTLGGKRNKIGRDGLAAILQMLTSNESLTSLGIYDDASLRQVDIVRIFRSLEKNGTLRSISLRGCKGVDGETVLQTIMDVLQVNPWIEDIDLSRTPLQNAGKTEAIYQRLGQNEKAEPEIDLLKDMPMTVPKSCRVFLCGQEYAGKTTLCNSVHHHFSSTKLPYIDQVRTLVKPIEQAVRPIGMKIKNFKDEDTKISIWNLAGQQEFYALHDLMFPGHGSTSLFLVISSLFRKPNNREEKTPDEVEEDLQYWLRFIVSNSRRALQQCVLPNVTVVLTHYDKINQPSQNLQVIVNSIQRLRDKFQGFVEFYPTVFTVDARSSASVSKLAHHLRKTSKTVLQRVPRVYELCDDLMQILSDWRLENHTKPAIKWKEFGDLCQVKVPLLRVRSRLDNKEKVEMRRKAVATCLHHIGEVIYFDELGFLILDCEWFCGEVLGQLIRIDVKKQTSVGDGFISRNELEKVLKSSLDSQIPGLGPKVFDNLDASDLVRMMLKLELCYEQDPSDPNSLMLIPCFLEEGRGKPPKWQINSSECVYAGRHLQCDDSSHMFLTPGFFPRLQVHLHNKIMGLKNQYGATYSLEKYLITMSINGIYVRIELGGQLGYYIDVLACSTKHLTDTLRLFQQLIIPAIQSLCHGVTLTEHIIRPECVRNLIPPKYRRNQFVPLKQLKQALLSVSADNMYDYQHTWDLVTDSGRTIVGAGFDYARDLLSDDDFREVLQCRYHDLHNLAGELQIPLDNNQDGQTHAATTSEETEGKIEPSFAGIAKGVEEVLQRLTIIQQELRDIKQEIQGLRYYEHRLLIELNCKVNYLVNYNVQVEERKVPNMFYFARTENYSRRLITTMISGMNALRLHMLCEYRGEMHVVEDQIGCEVMQVDNRAVKCLAPYMKKFMKLVTFALKIGAHLAAGMGEMIPDLSREVAHLLESPAAYSAAGAAAAGVVGVAAAGRVERNRGSRDIQQDLKAAQQWVVDFLRDQRCSGGRDIAEKFGLWRVRYRDNGQIAWICRRHMYVRANEVIEVPL
ncbi:PREDICTED: protein TORNADO 1 [Nicotiana attenuata]|uniref:Protein tornado 1 n=1 Tax=Nicotiana attenuata TaxID=49451 RepID=A0A1J6J724_NICAT|nr:PREDICTED: protein TORNADO 1 [Nicotiana attenuata]OIT06675.1 protein tornado 1 [Nicotiana attenuata]